MTSRPLTAVLLVISLTACVTWQPASIPPRDLMEQEQPDEVRITRVGGERLEVDAPQLRADAITGMSDGQPTRVPLSDLQGMEVRRFSMGRTLLALVPALFIASFCSEYRGSC